jgi:hypothetical protein
MDDARVSDSAILSLAAIIESERPDLRVVDERGAAIPVPGEADLLERLLALEHDHLMVALAERLDHARHLHLRPRDLWQERLALEEEVYLPLARRTGGIVAARYDRWHRSFRARRL